VEIKKAFMEIGAANDPKLTDTVASSPGVVSKPVTNRRKAALNTMEAFFTFTQHAKAKILGHGHRQRPGRLCKNVYSIAWRNDLKAPKLLPFASTL
jgi:hypothetical protein